MMTKTSSKTPGERLPNDTSFFVSISSILFVLVVAYFVFRSISDAYFVHQNPFVHAPLWQFVVSMTHPFLLLVTALCIFMKRRWSYAIAILLAGTVLYSNVFKALIGISYAHGISAFSSAAFRLWFQIESSRQIINTGLAAVLMMVATVQLSRSLLLGSKMQTRYITKG